MAVLACNPASSPVRAVGMASHPVADKYLVAHRNQRAACQAGRNRAAACAAGHSWQAAGRNRAAAGHNRASAERNRRVGIRNHAEPSLAADHCPARNLAHIQEAEVRTPVQAPAVHSGPTGCLEVPTVLRARQRQPPGQLRPAQAAEFPPP